LKEKTRVGIRQEIRQRTAMTRFRVATTLAALLLAAPFESMSAEAAQPGSPACKRELATTQKKMQDSIALLDRAKNAAGPLKCEALSSHITLAGEIRESFARCRTPDERAEAVRDADDVIDATIESYKKWCPPRPGMIRVKVTEMKRLTRDQLPKPLAAVHRCSDGPMISFDERFELGRLILLGCPGNPNPTPQEAAARNARPLLLQQEQGYLYLTRDSDGDDPHRLSFPILGADGRETSVDQILAQRVGVGDRRDEISAYWEPMTEGVCRVHVVWRVADAKASLVLWQEARDCSSTPTQFKTVLDRR